MADTPPDEAAKRQVAARSDHSLPSAADRGRREHAADGCHSLSGKFRGKLLELLKGAHAKGELQMTGGQSRLDDADRFTEFLAPLHNLSWVVWVEPPEAGPEVVLKYLARYTYRIAISNNRIASIDDGKVAFGYKDFDLPAESPLRYGKG